MQFMTIKILSVEVYENQNEYMGEKKYEIFIQ